MSFVNIDDRVGITHFEKMPIAHNLYAPQLTRYFKTSYVKYIRKMNKICVYQNNNNQNFYNDMNKLVSNFTINNIPDLQSKLKFDYNCKDGRLLTFSISRMATFFSQKNNIIECTSHIPDSGCAKFLFSIVISYNFCTYFAKFTIYQLVYDKNYMPHKEKVWYGLNYTISNIKCAYGKLLCVGDASNEFLIKFNISHSFTGECTIAINKFNVEIKTNLNNSQSVLLSVGGKLENELKFVIKLTNDEIICEKEFVLELYNTNSEDICPICTEAMDSDVFMTFCKHVFHTKCLFEYLEFNNLIENNKIKSFSCPMCRSINEI